ncbi:hypothetical protein DPMN_069693 [Dreissena polymorpha]|uniref:Uncharacterized protein n=1 Tax=Dreissena polymorpha TaxID=45954 RepID=A0A9D4BV53_DREPO|nr:hypothetical protein DPMN_069693 [Dreissena polymorpha]
MNVILIFKYSTFGHGWARLSGISTSWPERSLAALWWWGTSAGCDRPVHTRSMARAGDPIQSNHEKNQSTVVWASVVTGTAPDVFLPVPQATDGVRPSVHTGRLAFSLTSPT